MAGSIEPIPYNRKVIGKRLAVFDCETDPFLYGRDPRPFTCCFYDGEEYHDFWGDDCIDQFFDWLADQTEEYLIYAHNGGNFDFHFMLDYMDGAKAPFKIDGRLVKIELAHQEFRDSYSIIPVPLSAYDKMKFDYSLMERPVREANRAHILEYQRSDCKYLFELVQGFQERFGDRLTMASVALPMLRSFHGFETMSETIDAEMRPYFFGGRNQCFKTGIIKPSKGKWKIYDRNSMYPAAMCEEEHPISGVPIKRRKITRKTKFAKIRARNYGALCFRQPNGGLDFTVESGVFYASIHEIRAGLDTGTLVIDEVLEAIEFSESTNFREFVETYYALRMKAADEDDEVGKLFYKLILNSSYGKFAMDPRKFEDCWFGLNGAAPDGPQFHPLDNPDGWFPKHIRGEAIFWTRPNSRRHIQFLNVATAASITGAARANLLRAISGATNPIYCDTDSVICEDLAGVEFGEKKLGAWKTEAEGDVAAIAGKKLYAVFNEGEEVKKASKGAKLDAAQIMAVASGETIEYENPAPKFQLDGGRNWTTRRVSKTASINEDESELFEMAF